MRVPRSRCSESAPTVEPPRGRRLARARGEVARTRPARRLGCSGRSVVSQAGAARLAAQGSDACTMSDVLSSWDASFGLVHTDA
eukprot:6876915-Prymnesium_polylepis.1